MTTNTFTVDGNTFAINFTMHTVDQLKKIGLRACNPGDVENIFNLFSDRLKLAEVLWTCVKRKAKEFGIETQEQFEELLGGEELQAGFDALVEAFVRFAPADIRSAMWHAAKEFYGVVKKASEEFIAETTDMPTPEVVAA